jgi:hypothetical protein
MFFSLKYFRPYDHPKRFLARFINFVNGKFIKVIVVLNEELYDFYKVDEIHENGFGIKSHVRYEKKRLNK